MHLIPNLNPQQQAAVTAEPGPTLVLAGPGSGKTKVLTHRIAYLITNCGVRPSNILAVTFTNKAAREMETRVTELLGTGFTGVKLGTFHATCAWLMRREANALPIDHNFVIFDEDDQIKIIKQIIRDLQIDDKRHPPRGIQSAISNAKNNLILPTDIQVISYEDEVVLRVYQRYQNILVDNNAVDFDDMLLMTANLLKDSLEIRERYSSRFTNILVDEFQDTNQAQYFLLSALGKGHQNVFVVGDSDQSIYRWRGADYHNLDRFKHDFPKARIYLLEHNYRSSQPILDVAMAIIDKNPSRTRKKLFTDRAGGSLPVLNFVSDGDEQAALVVSTIESRIQNNHQDLGSFAVMYRTNAQSRLLEEAFIRKGIPYKIVGAQRFYGRKEIKDIIAYLRLVYNPNDSISLSRVINTPTRGIGHKTIQLLRQYASQVPLTPVQVLLDLGTSENSKHWNAFNTRAGSALARFGQLLDSWLHAKETRTPLELMDNIMENTGYITTLLDGTEEGRDRLENIEELRRLASEFDQRGISEFLEEVALISDQDTINSQANVPTLLTLHAAKGLEFPFVFIVGLDDGTLPHIRSFEDPEAMEEERRLFYVGITRAMDQLHLIWAETRYAFGYSEPTIPSRFFNDIPKNLVSMNDTQQHSSRSYLSSHSNNQSTDAFVNSRFSQPAVLEASFRAGNHIEHPTWGEGLVINSRILDDEEVVEIYFETEGIKRVAASFAKLKLLS